MKLRIMTSNVWADVFGNPVTERDDCLIKVIMGYMPDAVGFQEMHPHWHESKLKPALAEKGYVEVMPDLHGNPRNYTPLFFRGDRFEEVMSFFWKFTGPNDYDSKSATCAVMKEKESGKMFGCIASHFYYESNEKGNEARKQNAREILDCIKKMREVGDIPVFCVGDLNCDLMSEPYKILEEGGLKCTSLMTENRTNFICTWHEYPKYNKETEKYTPAKLSTQENKYSIDHVLATENVKVLSYTVETSEEARIASDHCPVVTDAEV